MKVKVLSIPVQNQEKALKFYTETLGFVKKMDVPLSEQNRWLTVVNKEEQDGTEILLEPSPNHFEPAKVYQKALMDAGIPYAQPGILEGLLRPPTIFSSSFFNILSPLICRT